MYKVTSYIKEENKQPSKLTSFTKRILLILITIFLSNFIFNIYFFKSNISSAVFLNPVAKEIIHTTATFINSRQNSKQLETIVLNILGESKDSYAVVVFNLETGERYYLNEERQFDTASLYKLWVMAVTYEQMEQGKFRQTDVLADSISALNKNFELTPDPAEDESQIISWPVQNALENMITVSDNDSAYLLTEKVGLDNISNFLTKQGLSDSKIGVYESSPQTSASDMAIFLERLYNGRLADIVDTSKMLNLMKNQQINTKLTKYLPDNVTR